MSFPHLISVSLPFLCLLVPFSVYLFFSLSLFAVALSLLFYLSILYLFYFFISSVLSFYLISCFLFLSFFCFFVPFFVSPFLFLCLLSVACLVSHSLSHHVLLLIPLCLISQLSLPSSVFLVISLYQSSQSLLSLSQYFLTPDISISVSRMTSYLSNISAVLLSSLLFCLFGLSVSLLPS